MSKSTFFFWCGLFLYVFGVGLWFRVFTNWFSRATARLGKGCIHTGCARPTFLTICGSYLFFSSGLAGMVNVIMGNRNRNWN